MGELDSQQRVHLWMTNVLKGLEEFITHKFINHSSTEGLRIFVDGLSKVQSLIIKEIKGRGKDNIVHVDFRTKRKISK
jgi:hypothetical protein